jgi:Leucine-rich repeat (LRR) protein
MKTTLSALFKLAVETRCIASLLVLAIAFAGCEKSDNNDPDTPTGPGIITFTAVPNSYDKEIYFYAIAQQLVVDWGDGSAPETYTNVYFEIYSTGYPITHTYTGSTTYTVQLKGEGLTHFHCPDNQLTTLDVSKCTALQSLSCPSNQLTTLDVSKCTALQVLYCRGNQLTTLDVSKCTALQKLECWSNQLTTLDVSKCTALQMLWCDGNQLTALNASNCLALQTLDCYGNQLTSLNVSGCTALQGLYCGGNSLTALDVSGCTALQGLYCGGNSLTATALNAVFTALPNYPYGGISISNNPGTATCNKAIAENKGWSVHWW